MNATLRENILFGSRFDPKYYKMVIRACGLETDFEMLPGGDKTEIGERGINLSGGQKQRVSLARAVYSRAEIYLLDDSLSAVDAHVGKFIFDRVIGPNGLLKDKARIFVTHGIQYLPESSQVVYLEDGRVKEMGTYEELMAKKGVTYNLMKDNEMNMPEEELSFDGLNFEFKEFKKIGLTGFDSKRNIVAGRRVSIGPSGNQSRRGSEANTRRSSLQDGLDEPTESTALISNEESSKGSVSWSVYKNYINSCSVPCVAILIFISILSQMLGVGQNVYLAYWASENDKSAVSTLETKDEVFWRLGIYGMLGVGFSITVILQVIFVWVFCGIRGSEKLHESLLDTVARLPMSFFDTTPLGRIINRFSKDIYTIDEVLPRSFQGFLRTLFTVLSVLMVNTLSSPFFLVFVGPLGKTFVRRHAFLTL